MTASNKRPQYFEKQLQEINDMFRDCRLTYEERYDNMLYLWVVNFMLKHNWYRGFNMYHDETRDGKTYRVLCGPEYESMDHYIQIY